MEILKVILLILNTHCKQTLLGQAAGKLVYSYTNVMFQDSVRSAAFEEMITKMGCVVKRHFSEMPIKLSVDVFSE